jgi:hypothetical protein
MTSASARLPAAFSAILLVAAADSFAPFDSYQVSVEHAAMSGSCTPDRFPDFLNRAYRFRSGAPFFGSQSTVTLENGKHIERGADGSPDWELSLEEQQPIRLGRQPAIILLFFTSHLRGSGSGTELLVVRCHRERLETVFEAGGEGIYPGEGRGYSYSEANELRVTHAVWLPEDPHAGPSRQVDELYGWDMAADHFRLTKRSEGRIKP